MPFANLKVPAGSLTAEQKKHLIDRVTDLYAEVFGEAARPNTLVLVDEVVDGGWGIGGHILTLDQIHPKTDAATTTRPSITDR
jgi:4-oxalocrotonate tautomerase